MNKVVENPKPIELEQHKPFNVERPLKYTETVHVPVDGKGSSSNLNTNVNGDIQNSTNPDSSDGFQELSAGYESHKIHKKA